MAEYAQIVFNVVADLAQPYRVVFFLYAHLCAGVSDLNLILLPRVSSDATPANFSETY